MLQALRVVPNVAISSTLAVPQQSIFQLSSLYLKHCNALRKVVHNVVHNVAHCAHWHDGAVAATVRVCTLLMPAK